jgi:hypothetical protein
VARAYTIATAALALSRDAKWLDNTLSHFKVPGVQQKTQGVARRLSVDSVVVLAVTIIVGDELGAPVARALEISQRLIATGGRYSADTGLSLELDLSSLRAQVLENLEQAVEIAPVPRRGRPPKSTTGRLD